MTLVCAQCGKSLGPDVQSVLVSAVDPLKSAENAKQSFAYTTGMEPRGLYQWVIQGEYPISTGEGVFVCGDCIKKSCPTVYRCLFKKVRNNEVHND
jgi:hypothetical protein